MSRIMTLQNQTIPLITDIAAEYIRNNDVIIAPTDTIYGILGSYFSVQARQRIYSIKNRPNYKQLIVLVNRKSELQKFSVDSIPDEILDLLPASLTLIMKNRYSHLYSEDTIAVRYPDNFFLNMLIEKSTCPLVAPSANIHGFPEITCPDQLIHHFNNRVSLIIKLDGILRNEKPSTILDITKYPYKILRHGHFDMSRTKGIRYE